MSHDVLTYEPVVLVATRPPVRKRRPARGQRLWRAARWFGRAIASASDWIFGAVALTIGLAVLSAMPVAQFLVFGYMLEAGGRVARTGRFRDGLVGIRKASRVGSMVVGVWLFWLPLQLVSSLATSAQLIDPGGPTARRWKVGLVVLTILLSLHVLAACARGGRVRHFLLPLGNPFWIVRRVRQGGAYDSARDAVWAFLAGLRLPYYFRLGLLGFVGTMLWLALPVSLMTVWRSRPLIGFLGALLLGVVALPLPFLQAQLASENRLAAIFGLRAVRMRYRRAPWSFAIALLLTLTAAVPLYLLKIEMIPRETAWLPSLVFLGFIFPARLLTGWAYGRGLRREKPRHWVFRWSGRAAMIPVAGIYLLIVFLSQFTAWRGVWSLYEQHAFLLPVPFLGM